MISLDSANPVIEHLEIDDLLPGTLTRFWLHLVTDGMGLPVNIPVLVAKGALPGPTVGITAAVHGNELNGVPIIQRLFKEIDPHQLKGAVIGVPVVNAPAFLRSTRQFIDGFDLNHIMPGKPDGNVSEVYVHRFIQRVVKNFEYLIDLHTASQGRINSYYIRADLKDPVTCQMASLQNAQILVHNPPSDGTLRGAAAALGINAVTLEVGDPNTFQTGHIRSGLTGIYNLLIHLGMIPGQVEAAGQQAVVCSRSYWLYTDGGGILSVHPKITERVFKGQLIATLRDVFGDVKREYLSPEDGIVIGKSINPINQTGGRIIHLGII